MYDCTLRSLNKLYNYVQKWCSTVSVTQFINVAFAPACTCDPHLRKKQDASGGEMQSVTVHLVTRSPAPQEGPTRPDEDLVSNGIVLQIIVDRANLIVRLVKITQARQNRTYENTCIRHIGKSLVNQQLKQLMNYCWWARAVADIVCTNMKQNKGSVSH